jgi:hypothetical protein
MSPNSATIWASTDPFVCCRSRPQFVVPMFYCRAMGRSKYTKELLTEAAMGSTSIAGVLRYLGIRWSGGSHHRISKRLRQLGVDTRHFTGAAHNKGKVNWMKVHPDRVLVVRPAGETRAGRRQLRRAMLEIGIPEQCAICGIGTAWQGKRLTLHIDHINGDFLDNRPENVRFLCPNCHSQTPTFANRRRDTPPTSGVGCPRDNSTSVGQLQPTKLRETPPWSHGPWIQKELEWHWGRIPKAEEHGLGP